MQAQLKKWGNSLALRIPARLARGLDMREDGFVELLERDGELVVRPKSPRVKYHLEELLAGVSRENLHAETLRGPAVGEENR